MWKHWVEGVKEKFYMNMFPGNPLFEWQRAHSDLIKQDNWAPEILFRTNIQVM